MQNFVGQFLNMYMSGGTHNTLCVHRITSHQIDYSWEKFPAKDKWIQVAHSHNMFSYSGLKTWVKVPLSLLDNAPN